MWMDVFLYMWALASVTAVVRKLVYHMSHDLMRRGRLNDRILRPLRDIKARTILTYPMNLKSFLSRSQVERFALRLQACMRGAHFFCASVLSFSNIWWLSFWSLEYECQKLHYSVSLLALGTFVDPESHEEFQSRRLSSPLPTLLCSSSISLCPSTPTPFPFAPPGRQEADSHVSLRTV